MKFDLFREESSSVEWAGEEKRGRGEGGKKMRESAAQSSGFQSLAKTCFPVTLLGHSVTLPAGALESGNGGQEGEERAGPGNVRFFLGTSGTSRCGSRTFFVFF